MLCITSTVTHANPERLCVTQAMSPLAPSKPNPLCFALQALSRTRTQQDFVLLNHCHASTPSKTNPLCFALQALSRTRTHKTSSLCFVLLAQQVLPTSLALQRTILMNDLDTCSSFLRNCSFSISPSTPGLFFFSPKLKRIHSLTLKFTFTKVIQLFNTNT